MGTLVYYDEIANVDPGHWEKLKSCLLRTRRVRIAEGPVQVGPRPVASDPMSVEDWYNYFAGEVRRDPRRIWGIVLPYSWRDRVPDGLSPEQQVTWLRRCRDFMTDDLFRQDFEGKQKPAGWRRPA